MSTKSLERIAPWVATALLIALWWACVRLFDIKSYVLPSPLETVQAMKISASR